MYIHLPFEKSIHLEEFNMLVLFLNSLLLKEEIVQISGSPVSHQLLQLQCFPKFLKILDPPFNFILPRFVWDCWTLLFLCYNFGSFEDGLRLSVYHFWKLNDYLLSADAFGLNLKFWVIDNFLFTVGSLLNNESGP